MRFLPALLCAVLLAVPFLAAAERPNVVLIFIDDMGFGDVGFNGGTAARTPHLDRMAQEGMRFHDFYVGCAVCSGSRTALLTGCHYKRLSMGAVLFPNSKQGLHPDEVTLADMLKEAGYRTACVGKWHLGHLPPCLPTDQGFESYYGIPYSNDMWIDPANKLAEDLVLREGLTREEVEAGHRQRNWVPLMRDEEVIEYPADQDTLTKRYTEESIRFIEENRERPFFLYLPHTMVHRPLAVSKQFADPEKQLIHNAIEEVDWSVGRILQSLRDNGLAERTLVIFTSDNGAAVGTSLPLRAKKGSVYDGGIREPTVMWWPGTIPAAAVCTEVAATIDLLPTLARLCGGKLPERRIDGKDIWPLMAGKEDAKSPHDAYVVPHGPGAVRSGKWKFYPWPEGQGGRRERNQSPASRHPVQLYDTLADIGETRNVAKAHPEVVERLQAAYKATLAEIEASRRPAATLERPAQAPSAERPTAAGKGKGPWTSLFDGRTLTGWAATSAANWRVEQGTIVVDDGERGFLVHEGTYRNYELRLEFKAGKGTNSGVFLNTKVKPNDVAKDCYELNIAPPDNPFPTGSLVGRKKYEGAGETNGWRRFEVRVKDAQVTVKLDGKQVMNYHADEPASGRRLSLQKNEGRVAFRNISVRKLR